MVVPIRNNWALPPVRAELPEPILTAALALQRQGHTLTEIAANLNAERSDIERALYWNVVSR